MEKENKNKLSFENNISNTEADIKKAHLVSKIIEEAEQGDEEVNKGRS